MSVFVSHDGDGTEVKVSTAKVKVTGLEEKSNAINAKFEAAYLEYPLSGWLNKDEPVVEVLRKAQADGTEVEVRIESQRKPGEDRTVTIQSLLDDKPNKTIIKKLVAVNNVYTAEALTNPEADPVTGRATSALGKAVAPVSQGATSGGTVSKEKALETLQSLVTQREISESVLDVLKAQALLAGATATEVIQASTLGDEASNEAAKPGYSREAPPFKELNSDGRLNLGGGSVATGIGVYNYVYGKLTEENGNVEPDAQVVEFYSALILAIADRIQVGAYGTGFRIDRTAGSHVRARSSIFTIIDGLKLALPVTVSGTLPDKETVNEFVQVVGKAARHNFLTGSRLSQQVATVAEVLSFLDGESTESDSQVSEAPAPAVVAPTASAPGVPEQQVSTQEAPPEEEYPEEEASYEEPSDYGNGIVDTTKAPEEVSVAPEVASTVPVSDSESLEWFPQDLLEPGSINSSNAPSEETLEMFRDFVINEVGLQTKAEQAKVAKLLAHTFGKAYSKASNIPDENLGDFTDFYVASGKDNFKAILDSL
jgi:hypothetical protein